MVLIMEKLLGPWLLEHRGCGNVTGGASLMPERSGIARQESGCGEMLKSKGFWSASGPEYRVDTTDSTFDEL